VRGVIGFSASIVIVVVGACRHGAPPRMPPPPEVGVVEVQPGAVPQSYDFTGQVASYRRVEVRARVDGIITKRAFDEGSVVHPGDLLYQIDKIRYQAAFQAAQARFQNAKRTLERIEPLLPQHAVAQQDVDNAHSEYEASQAALAEAKKDLDDTDIRAEIEGRVGRAMLEMGARVTGPSDLLTTIDQLDPVYVSFRPSSDQLASWHEDPRARDLIRPGSSLAVNVILPDGSTLPRNGRLNYVAPALDAATGTEEFRAVFANGDRLLMPGQFVRVRLSGFVQDSALAVPLRAVQSGMGRQFVYVVGAGDTAMSRDVQPGSWSGNLWIIEHGLNPGDRVVVDGTQKVIPGHPVRPVPLSDSSAAQASTRPGQ